MILDMIELKKHLVLDWGCSDKQATAVEAAVKEMAWRVALVQEERDLFLKKYGEEALDALMWDIA